MFRYLSFLVFALSASITFGVDVPYGADALPFNARKASNVVEAGSVNRLSIPVANEGGQPRLNYYECSVKTHLMPQTGETRMVFSVPHALDFKEAKEYENKLLFLEKITDDNERRAFPGSAVGPVYRLVAGRLSAIDISNPSRLNAIKSYLPLIEDQPAIAVAAAKPKFSDRRAAWCQEHMVNSDPFVRRSVMMELHRHSHEKEAVKILDRITQLDDRSVETNRDAINALQRSGLQEAVAPLRRLAEDANLTTTARANAVKAVGQLPGGTEEIMKWNSGKDDFLKKHSQIEIERASKSRSK